MKVEPIGLWMVALCFFLITVYPGIEYWYFGTGIFAVFLIWLAFKTFGKG